MPWRAVFVIFGFTGFIWTFLWIFIYHDLNHSSGNPNNEDEEDFIPSSTKVLVLVWKK